MATRALGADSARVIPSHLPPYVAFFAEPGTAQSRFLVQGYVDRDEIATAAQALVDLLDTIDGDPDLEPDGDEADGNGSEDDFMRHGLDAWGEPGCPIADPGGGNVEDEGEGIDEREPDPAL